LAPLDPKEATAAPTFFAAWTRVEISLQRAALNGKLDGIVALPTWWSEKELRISPARFDR
jgi:hypothetical protein